MGEIWIQIQTVKIIVTVVVIDFEREREREIANREVDDGYNSKHRLTLFNKFTIILIFMVIIHLNVEDNFDFNT
jgi:hypothetical protein